MFGVSLCPLSGFIIFTREVSLVGFSLVLSLGSPLESPNPGSDLSSTLLREPFGLWFGSDVEWGIVIYFISPSRTFITSNINSVRYFQLLELQALSLSLTRLIPTSGRR